MFPAERADARHVAFQTTLNKNVHLIAFGKAVIGMVQAVLKVLGDQVVDGIVSLPFGKPPSTGLHILLSNAQYHNCDPTSDASTYANRAEAVCGS